MRPRPLAYDANVARRHLVKSDPVMREIVKRVGACEIAAGGQPYQALIRSILYQQLAGPAAAAIERRFLALSGNRIPKPGELMTMSHETLRAAGVSRQKAGYLRSVAEHYANGGLSDRKLTRAADDDVIEAVTQIKGVGRWTADMLLMFCMGRADVLPVGDLGIQNAMKMAYKLAVAPKPDEMIAIAEPWRPYRSVASWYLWRQSDTVTL